MVKVTIDGIEVQAEEGMTILAAAKIAGVNIPTLCWLKKVNDIGACRVCVVEVEGEERMCAACNTTVADGMHIHTNTPGVIRARRTNLKMILSEHRSECTSCVRSGTCALQKLAADMAVDSLPFAARAEKAIWDKDFKLQRDASKCIKCMRCVAICEKIQHCKVWDFTGTGPHMKVTTAGGTPIADAGCALCGQCITHCPTGALTAHRDIDKVIDALMDPQVMTVVQLAPAVRSSWGEGVGLTHEQASQPRMVAAARRLGFDYVFDTDFAADLTIMEEGSEFLEYLGDETKELPMFTSCCPGWVRFAKLHYPEFVGQLSTSKSPHQMMGAVVKNTMREAAEADGKQIFCVSIMPCVAKKYECDVPQLSTEAGRDVDAVLTVREFDRMLNMFGIRCADLPEEGFDDPLGLSTGAATIFGRTGGVMEAALRTAAYLLTGENPDFSTCDCTEATPEKPWTEKRLEIAGKKLAIAICSGLDNTSQLLDALKNGSASYDFVEVMACPGGCVGGGGQPIEFNRELAKERAGVLNALDENDTLRRSHENPDIARLYETWLDKPLSETAESWLHTDQETWDI